MEFRIKDCQLQADETGSLKVGGYINVTERESEMLYNKKNGKWFKETMKKGVFKRAIERAGKNIPLLFEHDWNKQLASLEEGTLELREDNIGLRFDAVIKDESIYEQVKAGIINSCSFGFRALAEEVESINTKLEKRFVSAIELLEVSLVKNPAYVGSLCETRSYEEELKEEERAKCGGSDDEKREENPEVEVEEEKAEEREADSEETETEENSLEEAEDEKDEDDTEEDSDKRFNESAPVVDNGVITDCSLQIKPEVDKDYIKSVVDELIEAKLAEIKNAEVVEEAMNQELQLAKDFHEEVEKELETQSMSQSSEVLRLRLQLLKLKDIKRGI